MWGLKSPEDGEGAERIVDWMELVALFSEDARARVDVVADSLEMAQDYEEEDIARFDEWLEGVQTDVAEEVKRRARALERSYPYVMSDNGEELLLERDDGEAGQLAYLTCLIVDHSWSSGLLVEPATLNAREITHARQLFEIIATVAACGFANGPAFHIGANRRGARGLLACIGRVCARAGEGAARLEPPEDAPPDANDDGVDVIALALERDGRPARSFIFGQAASGANWKTKSVLIEVGKFLDTWFDRQPARWEGVMLVPTMVPRNDTHRQAKRVGHILHRLRLPRYVRNGAQLIELDATMVDVVGGVADAREWINQYLDRVRGEVGS